MRLRIVSLGAGRSWSGTGGVGAGLKKDGDWWRGYAGGRGCGCGYSLLTNVITMVVVVECDMVVMVWCAAMVVVVECDMVVMM
ncbi:hypothetical protein E2C01_018652 [Portunus trituberculatus]|uniref:Transmembrane protein n=1 Tax=Portunus trituberculatus TaxID=210409 RepID=A0A5B7DX46_PORTR|nr:hypothetical protein [Portunus trituberculatus]